MEDGSRRHWSDAPIWRCGWPAVKLVIHLAMRAQKTKYTKNLSPLFHKASKISKLFNLFVRKGTFGKDMSRSSKKRYNRAKKQPSKPASRLAYLTSFYMQFTESFFTSAPFLLSIMIFSLVMLFRLYFLSTSLLLLRDQI